jgi:Tol biopolymer transport system component
MKSRLLLVASLIVCSLLLTRLPEIESAETSSVSGKRLFSEALDQSDGTPYAVLSQEEVYALAAGRLLPVKSTQAPVERPPAPSYLPAQSGFISAGNSLPPASLAFQSNRAGQFGVYSQAPGTAQAELLIAGPGNNVTPVWSPDGRELIFASDRAGTFSIYRLTGDGLTLRLTDNAADDFHPAWSPDGQTIIFSSGRGGAYYQIFTMNADGENRQQLTAVPGNHLMYPRYSPDGARIAFMRASIPIPACDWNWDIWLMDANGGNHQRETTYIAGDLYPEWLSNEELIYTSCPWLIADLYRRNVVTGQEINLTNTLLTSEWGAVYLPGYDYIAYNSSAPGKTDVYLQHLPTSTVTNLTANAGSDDMAPSWQGSAQESTLISGRVTRFGGRPLPQIPLSLHNGVSVISDESGYFSFNDLAPGTYTVSTPQESTDYTFTPGAHTVSVPPGVFGRDFVGKDCRQATATPPILIVTGWSGSVSQNLYSDSQLAYFIDWLEGRNGYPGHGYFEGCNLFYARHTTATKNLKENGLILGDELCAYAAMVDLNGQPWNREFDVIAHSYGGLRTRAMLENDDLYTPGSGPPAGLSCGGNSIRVRNLFMMGTPNGGAWPDLPLAAVIGALAVIRGGEWIAMKEMLPPVRLAQNLSHTQPEGVSYYLIGGDARAQWPVFATFFLVQQLTGHYGYHVLSTANDLAVQQASVHALAGYPLQSHYPQAFPMATFDLHGDIPYLHLPSYMNPQATFQQIICPHLATNNPCNQSGAAALVSRPAPSAGVSILSAVVEQQQAQMSPPLPQVDIAAGTLAADEVVTGHFVVEAAGPAAVYLYWFGGDVELALKDPTGAVIDRYSAGGDPNVDTLQFDTGLGLIAGFQITGTVAGAWTYTVTAASLLEPTPYRLTLLPTAPIAVSGAVPTWQPAGLPVVITAAVTYSATIPLAGGTVFAQIQQPDGFTHALTLLDDGNHHDGAANDGVFGGVYTPLASGGVYGILLTANGVHNGKAYTRTAPAVFTVAPANATLSGQYSDRVLANNPLGLYEALEVAVDLMVSQPSTFTLSADLFAGNSLVAPARTTVYLMPGSQTVELLFDGRRINAGGFDGPYTVRNVLLLDEAVVTVLIEAADNVYTTADYDHSQFGTPLRVYLPLLTR